MSGADPLKGRVTGDFDPVQFVENDENSLEAARATKIGQVLGSGGPAQTLEVETPSLENDKLDHTPEPGATMNVSFGPRP